MMNTDFTEKQLSSELVYDGQLLKVHKDKVLLPDGKTAGREWIHHPGAVVIVAMPSEQTVLIERQFRYPLRQHFYELPAGKIEPGETPLRTAQRELIEECGYDAKSWHQLTTLHPCIGYSNERIELYLASDLVHVGHHHDDGEFLETMELSFNEALDWIASGRISDVKTITGLLWMSNKRLKPQK